MNWQERIVVDPGILVGKPVIEGTRLAVEFIVDPLAQRWSEREILKNYPELTREDIRASLAYAGAALHEERVYPLSSTFGSAHHRPPTSLARPWQPWRAARTGPAISLW